MQWGTVRMLGIFLTGSRRRCRAAAVWLVAEQPDVDGAYFAEYGGRGQTA
ncbi:hypothetical protein O7599_05850 [Streptomyces sp. WMMC500]|nr:hypothetical protein [Streptomyces sp. WMMC500]WBB62064.1 hypothetical protein O7599_05850 [Streptomyces sp. WMMC500]